MISVDLTKMELLNVILEYDIEGRTYDLHNDFECKSIELSNRTLKILFKELIEDISMTLEFNEVEILREKFELNRVKKSMTLDNFQRCRSLKDGTPIEYDDSGRVCFLMEFVEGQEIELLATTAELRLR